MSGWKLASYWGISTSGNPDADDAAFNAGHLNDVLRLDEFPFPVILVAADTSGVWLINSGGGIALPLSGSWDQPNLNSLARGVHGTRHVYAGGDALWETDSTKDFVLFNWRKIPIVDSDGQNLNAGGVIDIAVLSNPNLIVLACGNGIFWADIPAPGGTYLFKGAPLMPAGAYSGVEPGPDGTVVAAAWGSDKVNHFGLFNGGWSGGNLLFNRSSIFGNVNPAMMQRTSVASCRQDRSVLYAVAGTDYLDNKGNVVNETIYRVLKSVDGGASWRVTGSKVLNATDPLFGDPTKNLPGNQEGYNNCITVSSNPNLVALGWRGGYFWSSTGGADWTMVSANGPHLHSDLHAVEFDQFDPAQRTVYVCSDGGLATTTDLGASHASLSNRQLPNLQIYRLAASYQDSGVVGISLQDNGDDYTSLYPNPEPWRDLDGGDGVTVTSMRNGQLVYRNNTEASGGIEFGNRMRAARWNASSRRFENVQMFPNPPLSWGVIPLDDTSDGLPFPNLVEIVNSPQFRNDSGESMIGIAAKDDHVFGLFARTTGDGMHWTQLTAVPLKRDDKNNLTEGITAIGSSDGRVLFVGTDNGRIVKLTAPSWTVTDQTPTPTPGSVRRFVVHTQTFAFAIASGLQLLTLTGTTWDRATGPAGATGDFTAIETDWTTQPKALFVSTDNRVYASHDEAKTWTNISSDLPETPHCSDLRFVAERSDVHFLYLATYGRSVFRLRLNAAEVPDRLVTVVGRMDMVDRTAFGHDIWAHPHFSNTARLGPEHPVEEISIVEDDGDELRVELNLHLQWFLDGSVDVSHQARLISKDEDNRVEETKQGSFKLHPGATQDVVEDLASDEPWPDRAHIEFTVSD